MRDSSKKLINAFAAFMGVKVVSAHWGPRGFAECFRRAKVNGFCPATIIDVGASDGRWTLECINVFPSAQYFLIEPLEENRERLNALAKSSSGIQVWHGALGANSGSLPLNTHGDQSSFLPSIEYPGEAHPVEVRTLDSFLISNRYSAPFLLKADVQGYELEVLKGAEHCLAHTEMLLLEVSFRRIYEGIPLAHEVISFIGNRGFRIYDICSYVQRPGDGELAQADIVFVRRESPLFAYEGWS